MIRRSQVTRTDGLGEHLRARAFPSGSGNVIAFKYRGGEDTVLSPGWHMPVHLTQVTFEIGDVSAVLGSEPAIALPAGIYQIHIRVRVSRQYPDEPLSEPLPFELFLNVNDGQGPWAPGSYVSSDLNRANVAVDCLYDLREAGTIGLSIWSYTDEAITATCEEFSGFYVAEAPPPEDHGGDA